MRIRFILCKPVFSKQGITKYTGLSEILIVTIQEKDKITAFGQAGKGIANITHWM